MPKTKESLSKKEILENIDIQAKKLALLLHYSTMPPAIKEAWVELLPKMSLKQIDRLLNILEAKYLDHQTKKIDQEYKKELKKAVVAFEKQKQKTAKDFLKRIAALKKSVKK